MVKFELEMVIDCGNIKPDECHEILYKALEDAGWPCITPAGDPCGHVSISHGDPHKIWIFYYDKDGEHESTSSANDQDVIKAVASVKKASAVPPSAAAMKTKIALRQVTNSKRWKLTEVTARKAEIVQKIKDAKDGVTKTVKQGDFEPPTIKKVAAKHDNVA